MLKQALAAGIMAIMLVTSVAEASLTFTGTRVIFSGEKKEGVLNVQNEGTVPYLMQTWVTIPDDQKNEAPFFLVPPLSRVAPEQRKAIRVLKTKRELPQDRETFYWLNVKAIPSVKPKDNQVVLVVNTSLKLFYRPAGLTQTPESAAEKLTWRRVGDKVEVNNPTPFYFTFFKVKLGEDELNTNMVAPFSRLQLDSKNNTTSSQLKWQYIDDFGVSSKWMTATL